MPFGRLIESGGDNLGFDAALHVGHFLRTLVNQEHDDIDLWMVIGNSVGKLLQEHGLTGFRRSYDQTALAFADRREHIHQTHRDGIFRVAGQCELFIREKRGQVIEGDSVADFFRRTSVDSDYLAHREVFFTFTRGTYRAFYRISGLET